MSTARLVIGAALAVTVSAGSAFGVGLVQIRYSSADVPWRTGSGGEFLAVQSGDSSQNILGQYVGSTSLYSETHLPASQSVASNAFMTFCLEHNEFLGGNTQNYHYTVDSYAVAGMNGQDPGTVSYNTGYGTMNTAYDTLDANTKWLYWAFRTGVLADSTQVGGAANVFRYTGTTSQRAADGSVLQNLIWGIEDTTGVPGGKATAWLAAANAANAGSNPKPWIYQVQVLNTFYTAGSGQSEHWTGNSQSQLTIDVTLVPLPPAAYAGLGSLAALGLFSALRRRKLNKTV